MTMGNNRLNNSVDSGFQMSRIFPTFEPQACKAIPVNPVFGCKAILAHVKERKVRSGLWCKICKVFLVQVKSLQIAGGDCS